MRKKVFLLLSMMLALGAVSCGKKKDTYDETLIDPDYIFQEYETSASDEGDTIINGFYRVESSSQKVILFIPYIENKQEGVFYLDDHHVKESFTKVYKDNILKNMPMGTSSQQNTGCNLPFIEGCTVPDFALKYYNPGKVVPNWNISDRASYAFSYAVENAGDVKSTSQTMITSDVCAISVAMYEEIYNEKPTMKVSVYGVPKSLFKTKFGKTFGSKEFLKYCDTLKKDNYKSCDLLCTKNITETGVYYIDYSELNKKGDYINYIIDYRFEGLGEKVYFLTEIAGEYNVSNNDLFNQWKQEHVQQMINN